MPIVNPLLQPNVGSVPTDTTTNPTDTSNEVEAPNAAPALSPQAYVAATGLSTFEGVKPGASTNVLTTAPPVEGGGKTRPQDMTDALVRMQFMQVGQDPIVQGLVRSTEEGKAPAVASTQTSLPKVGSAAVASNSNLAANPSAAANAQTTTPPAQASSGYTTNVLAKSINSDMSGLDSDLKSSAATIVSDANVAEKGGKCKKGSATGENQINDKLRHMGLNKDQARTIARTLYNNSETGGKLTAHNDAETTIIAASIALYDKLGASGGNKNEASKQIVTQLAAAADNQKDAAKTTTAEAKYNTAINTLRAYDLQGTTASATEALTTPQAQQTLVSYNWHTAD